MHTWNPTLWKTHEQCYATIVQPSENKSTLSSENKAFLERFQRKHPYFTCSLIILWLQQASGETDVPYIAPASAH